jgi:glycosyltransferase involved in cell wall biosynthesis
MELSVIVPLYNEEESICPLYNAITKAISTLDYGYEILLVDDGSKDQTFIRAKELANEDHRLRVIRFRKNCGQTPAIVAGIDQAKGKIVVTMDGDLQNDPSDIPVLLNKIEEGYDIVVGWRHKRRDKLITRKIPSTVANKIGNLIACV